MSTFFKFFITAIFLWNYLFAVAVNENREMATFTDSLMQAMVDRYKLPNASVALVADGEFIFMQGYGYADHGTKRTVDPRNSLFRNGSVSKLFTWTAVMQLVEQGRLDLDIDVNQYLDFIIPDRIHGPKHSRETRPVTLRHLMTHTAGFEDVVEGLFFLDADDHPPLKDYLVRYRPERIYPPGEIMAYSNFGTALAGYIVELASGKQYEDYVEEYILRPLGMENSTFYQPPPVHLRQNMVNAYRWVEDGFRKGDFEFMPAPAGGMTTTAEDMALYMLAYIGDRGKESILTDPLRMFNPLFSHHPLLGGMAHGFKYSDINGQRIVFHAGSSMLFDAGLYMIPEAGIGLFLCYSGGMYTGHVEVFNSFMQRFFPVEKQLPEVFPDAGVLPDPDRLPGEYQQSRRIETGRDKLLNLVSGVLRIRSYKEGDLDADLLVIRSAAGLMKEDDEKGFVIDLLGTRYHLIELTPGIYMNLEAPALYPFGPILYLVADEDPQGRLMLATDGPVTFIRMPFYATSGFAAAIAGFSFIVILLNFICQMIAEPARLFRRKRKSLRKNGNIARYFPMLHSVLAVLMLAIFAINAFPDPVYQLPPAAFGQITFLDYLLVILPWLTGILTIPITIFCYRIWKERWLKTAERIWYTLYMAAAIAVAWLFMFYNLIG